MYNSNQNVNDEIFKDINGSLIEFKKYINTEKISKNENPNKIVNILEKILNLNPLRPTGHWCPANVIACIFTIKLLHFLFLGTIDQRKVKIYKKLKKI